MKTIVDRKSQCGSMNENRMRCNLHSNHSGECEFEDGTKKLTYTTRYGRFPISKIVDAFLTMRLPLQMYVDGKVPNTQQHLANLVYLDEEDLVSLLVRLRTLKILPKVNAEIKTWTDLKELIDFKESIDLK